MSDGVERNKEIIRARHEAVQAECLGSAGDPRRFMAGQQRHFLAADPSGGGDAAARHAAALVEWHSQTVSPTFHSYGPMIAEGDCVVEEWETFIHGQDGALYNNHYCWIQRVADEHVVEVREYVDSHHVWTICGRNWPELVPPTERRASNLETVDAELEFDLAPSLLRDARPSTGRPTPPRPDGDEGAGATANKAVVRALHDAQAAGDQAAITRLYAEEFSHYMAGERPFGWDHLPLEEIYAPLVAHLASPLRVAFGPMVAEGDSVVEEMESFAQLDDGTVYNNWHCFIHELRDGKIVETREYLDTHHMWVVLGRWAEWATEPVPPSVALSGPTFLG